MSVRSGLEGLSMMDAMTDTTTDTRMETLRARAPSLVLSAKGAAVGTFFGWWWRQIKGLLPGAVISALAPAHSTITIFDRDKFFDVHLSLPDSEGQKLEGVSWPASGGSVPAELIRLLADVEDAKVRLVLVKNRMISSDIDLPKMSELDRGRAAQLRYESELPLKSGVAWHAHILVEAGDDSDRVRLIAAHRQEVDGLTTSLAGLGLRPSEVIFQCDDVDAPRDVMFPGAGVRVPARVAVRDKLLGVGPLLILLVALTSYAIRLDLEDARITSDVAGASAELKGLAELTDAFEQDRRMSAFLGTRLARPSAATVIDEITGALPDDAWLSGLRMNGNEVRLTGLAANPPDLVAPLEALQTFDNVRLTSAIALRAEEGRRQFEVTLDVAGEAR